jgi:hypothetical protein
VWRLLIAALGAWLMAAPQVLGYDGTAVAVAHHVLGPVAVGSGLLAAWPVLRGLRWLGLLSGVLVLAAILLPGGATYNGLVVGLLIVALSLLPGGETGGRFGGGWRSLLGGGGST